MEGPRPIDSLSKDELQCKLKDEEDLLQTLPGRANKKHRER